MRISRTRGMEPCGCVRGTERSTTQRFSVARRAEELAQVELTVPWRITVQGTEHFIAQLLVKRSRLVLEGIEARANASARASDFFCGHEQLRADALSTGALVDPEFCDV